MMNLMRHYVNMQFSESLLLDEVIIRSEMKRLNLTEEDLKRGGWVLQLSGNVSSMKYELVFDPRTDSCLQLMDC